MPIAVTPDFSIAPSSTVKVDTVELMTASAQLVALAGRYEGIGQRLAPLAAQVGLLAAADVSGQGSAAFSVLTAGAATALALAFAAQKLAAGIRTAAANYEAAESFATEVLSRYATVRNLGTAAARAYMSAFAYPVANLIFSYNRNLNRVNAISPHTAFFINPYLLASGLMLVRESEMGRAGMARATDYLHDKAKAFGLARGLKTYENVSAEIDPWKDPETGEDKQLARPPVHAAELAEMNYLTASAHQQVDDYYDGRQQVNESDHAVIQRYVDGNGQERVVVNIPGSDGELADLAANYDGGPLSWSENLANASLMDDPDVPLSEASAMMQLIDRMLEEEGIDPDTPIMLNGYSQGGAVAMALANNKEFRNKYNVQVVATQSSPVNGVPTPAGVDHIRMGNEQDYVPLTQPDNPAYQPTEEYRLNYGGDVHGSKNFSEQAAGSEQFHQDSEVLADFFDGDFQAADTAVYAGSSQKADLTQTELEQQRIAGVAHGTADVYRDLENISRGLSHAELPPTSIPLEPVNPVEVYQQADDAVDWVNDTLIAPGDAFLEEKLQSLNFPGIELHNPELTWNPWGGEEPPIPMPGDGVKTYEANPIEVSPSTVPAPEAEPAPEFAGASSGAGSNF